MSKQKQEQNVVVRLQHCDPRQSRRADAPGVFAKRMAIRDTFIDAYTAYDSTCHGQDELVPVGAKCHNWVGMGLTLLGSLDSINIRRAYGRRVRIDREISEFVE